MLTWSPSSHSLMSHCYLQVCVVGVFLQSPSPLPSCKSWSSRACWCDHAPPRPVAIAFSITVTASDPFLILLLDFACASTSFSLSVMSLSLVKICAHVPSLRLTVCLSIYFLFEFPAPMHVLSPSPRRCLCFQLHSSVPLQPTYPLAFQVYFAPADS